MSVGGLHAECGSGAGAQAQAGAEKRKTFTFRNADWESGGRGIGNPGKVVLM